MGVANAYYECLTFACVAGGSIYERAFAGDVTYKRVIDLLNRRNGGIVKSVIFPIKLDIEKSILNNLI